MDARDVVRDVVEPPAGPVVVLVVAYVVISLCWLVLQHNEIEAERRRADACEVAP